MNSVGKLVAIQCSDLSLSPKPCKNKKTKTKKTTTPGLVPCACNNRAGEA